MGEVIDGDIFNGSGQAMTYTYYYQKVVKGKSPKNAPTYLPDEDKKHEVNTSIYVCQICDYIFEGEIIPKYYICPICG